MTQQQNIPTRQNNNLETASDARLNTKMDKYRNDYISSHHKMLNKSEPKSDRVCDRIVFAEKRRKALELREDLKVILSRVEMEHNNFLALFDGKEDDNPHNPVQTAEKSENDENEDESEDDSEESEESESEEDLFEEDDLFDSKMTLNEEKGENGETGDKLTDMATVVKKATDHNCMNSSFLEPSPFKLSMMSLQRWKHKATCKKSKKQPPQKKTTKEISEECMLEFFENSAILIEILKQVLETNKSVIINEHDPVLNPVDKEYEQKERQVQRDTFRTSMSSMKNLEEKLAKMKSLGDELLSQMGTHDKKTSKALSKGEKQVEDKFWKAVDRMHSVPKFSKQTPNSAVDLKNKKRESFNFLGDF